MGKCCRKELQAPFFFVLTQQNGLSVHPAIELRSRRSG